MAILGLAVEAVNRLAAEHTGATAGLMSAVDQIVSGCQTSLGHLADLVQAYDPVPVLRRGFSITLNAQGKAIRGTRQIEIGETILTRLAEGEATSTVTQADSGAPSHAN